MGFKNFGLIRMLRAGMRIRALSRHIKTENMIRKAKYFIVKKDEMNNTEKPIITVTALIVIPLPVVVRVV